ncbi:MAG: hypothetical protein CMJ78_25785 [Planctomycetaceae bacterium]|nr:hypothetical protein [Planctomycetaceae bacterium]
MTQLPTLMFFLRITSVFVVALAMLPTANGDESARPSHANSRFTARLPEGRAVEFLGVTDNPSNETRWWTPDGQAIRYIPPKSPSIKVSQAGIDEFRQFEFFVRNIQPGDEVVANINSQSGFGFRTFPIKNTKDVSVRLAAGIPTGIPQVNINLRVESDKWTSILSIKQPQQRDKKSLDDVDIIDSIGSLRKSGKSSVITISHHLRGSELRVVGIDKKGKRHSARQKHSITKKLRKLTATFEDLKPNELKSVEIERRKTHHVEYRNVALNINGRTQCQMVIHDTSFATVADSNKAATVWKSEAAPSFQTAASKQRRQELYSKAVETAVKKGLKYLLEEQRNDGFVPTKGNFRENIATTAFAGWALLQGAERFDDAEILKAAQQAARFVTSCQTEDGSLVNPHTKSPAGRMYGHGYALHFLAKYYLHAAKAKEATDELRTAIAKAIKYSVENQIDDGSWGYTKVDGPLGRGDVSNTACQISAILAAGEAGFDVPVATLTKTRDYLLSAQREDGGFLYVVTYQSPPTYARSAAVMAALSRLPKVKEHAVENGFAFMKGIDAHRRSREPFYMYGAFFSIIAYQNLGSDDFCQWYEDTSKLMLTRQASNGSWNVIPQNLGPNYGTAVTCLVLQSIQSKAMTE